MRMRSVLMALALLAVAGEDLGASQEGALAWTAFSIQSAGTGRSGPVEVSGAYVDDGLARLTIKALGREFSLSKPQLETFRGMFVNRMQLTYEDGYKELGGRTLYIVLGRGFTSEAQDGRLITLKERGDVTIRDHPERGRRTTR